ncbi:MAG: UbiA family prenyltransferase [Gammaproteobacteria bacterium]|nr:UbiA family prenyltransferase [Gammaproteobacteria bacterium]
MNRTEPLLARWWIYQRERFPLLAHGLLIALFAVAAVSYSDALQTTGKPLTATTFVTAFIGCFGFFLLLRIADEFKDSEDDLRYRAYRPVPRGLITLGELRTLAIITIALQLACAWWLDSLLLLPYLLTLGYFMLMGKEFFAHRWLRSHPLAYLFSHMLIMPLIAFYASAHQWLPHQPPAALAAFLAVSFFTGIVFEIGRKIRSPEMEEQGVETYSALWGRPVATGAWLLALLAAEVSCICAAALVGPEINAIIVALLFLALAGYNAYAFLQDADKKSAKRFETLSGLWTLSAYAVLGILPLVSHHVR